MPESVLAFDLGTGSCKASLWLADGTCLAERTREYFTAYLDDGRQEQRPADWWAAVVGSTRDLLASLENGPPEVAAIAVSGHSLGTILLDEAGETLLEHTPIWSDARGRGGAQRYFAEHEESEWYERTGNGFPPALYPVFKLSWFAEHEPRAWASMARVVGSKDWIVRRFTGVIATDPSYASGTGAFDLARGNYDDDILARLNLPSSLLPPIVPSSSVVGELTSQAAELMGLRPGIPVAAGGVDNSCMSAGSGNVVAGRTFLSLGSSSWAVATRDRPVLDTATRPYTFASLIPGLFDSALSTFTAGTALRWIRETLLGGGRAGALTDEELIALASESEPGARGLTFLPMLAGGSPLEGGPDVRGALIGLDAQHTAADVARAALEGPAFALARAEEHLASLGGVAETLTVTGGGAQSSWVRGLYASILDRPVVSLSVDRQAAALGAAATGFVAVGLWRDVTEVGRALHVVDEQAPLPRDRDRYARARDRFERLVTAHSTSSA